MSKTPTAPTDVDDIQNPKFAASALDFLLIELVPLAQRVTEQLEARQKALQDEYKRSRIFNKNATERTTTAAAEDESAKDNKDGKSKDEPEETRHITSLGFPQVAPLTHDRMLVRLDALGYRVGQGLVERFSANTPRPQTQLDMIKFLCKDMWLLLFRKQIDNLKTNHRGIFVLTDTRFQPLSRMSIDRRAGPKARAEGLERALLYLYFPSGVIRGALSGLGMEATVTAEVVDLPIATFQIKTKGAKA